MFAPWRARTVGLQQSLDYDLGRPSPNLGIVVRHTAWLWARQPVLASSTLQGGD